MVDAKLNSNHSLETRSHVGSHACQPLSYQSRYPSMQHLEWLFFSKEMRLQIKKQGDEEAALGRQSR